MIVFWLEWVLSPFPFEDITRNSCFLFLPILKKNPDAWASIRSQPYRFEDGYNLLQTNKNTMELFAQNFLFL